MDSLTKLIMQQLAGGGLSQISRQIGADEETTSSALSAAVPMLLQALSRNASQPSGAQSLLGALDRDHDGSVLDDLAGFLGNPESANGAGILGHILGGKQQVVSKGLSQGTGLNMAQIGKLLTIAAPLVMGFLGRNKRQQNFDAGGLADFLGGQSQRAQEENPDMMGALGNLLDLDGDGSAADDVLGIVGKLFSK